MGLEGIAARSHISAASLESVLEGVFPEGSGGPWGITSTTLQKFVDGEAIDGIGSLFGVQTPTAQELRDKIGRDGAIGLLVGFALGAQKNK
jgi:hypothetical protein